VIMKTYIIGFLFFVLLIKSFGQSQQSSKIVDSLIWYHYDNRYMDTEASILQFKQIASEAHIDNYYWGEMKSLQFTGELYQMLGVKDSCRHYIERSIELSEKKEDKKQIAISKSVLARLEQQLGNYPNAIKEFEASLSMFEQIGDTSNVAWTHYDMSWVYMLSDDLDSSMVHGMYGMQYAEAIRDTQLMGGSYNTIGTIHKKLGNFDKAEAIYLKCIEMYEGKSYLEHLLVGPYNNIGLLYKAENKNAQSLDYYDKMEAVARKYQDDTALMTVWINKGSLYNELHDYAKAEKNLIDAIVRAKKTNMSNQLADASNRLAQTYIGQGKYELAKPLVEEAIAMSTSIGSWERELEAQKTAKVYYQWKGNTQGAISAMERVVVLQDSLFQKDMAAQVNTLQQKYQSAKQEATIQKLDAEQKTLKARQLLFLLGGLSLIVIGGAFFYGYYLRNKNQKMRLATDRQMAITERKKVQAELEKKSKELTTNILQLAERNKLLQSYRSDLIQIGNLPNQESKQLTERLVRRVETAIDDNTIWTRLTEEFKVVHADFLNALGPKGTKFSKAELRLIALLKMNLSSKEIAQILHISAEGVKKARQRLRKKLELDTTQDLQKYILNN